MPSEGERDEGGPDLLEKELRQKKTIELGAATSPTSPRLREQRFYAEPQRLKPGDEAALKAIVYDPGSYFEYQPAACGGFHGDWALVWEKDGRRAELLMCFGCQEWLAYLPGPQPRWLRGIMHGSGPPVAKRLAAILRPYQLERPKSWLLDAVYQRLSE